MNIKEYVEPTTYNCFNTIEIKKVISNVINIIPIKEIYGISMNIIDNNIEINFDNNKNIVFDKDLLNFTILESGNYFFKLNSNSCTIDNNKIVEIPYTPYNISLKDIISDSYTETNLCIIKLN